MAFQALYAWDIQCQSGCPTDDLSAFLSFSWNTEGKLASFGPEITAFARLVVAGVVENCAKIDETIKNTLENWDFTRLNAADRAVLRFGVYLLLYQRDLAPALVIEEAIKISMEFSGSDSYKFVNGVLDAVRASCR